jgi:energy-coupling factor transporter ATP-binding protein EcfA2
MDTPRPVILTQVAIDGLFGYLNHRIHFDRDRDADPNINLLYGENGTGKTTILRLIYSCLSGNGNEGLRGFIAMVPFKRLVIDTTVGARFEIDRNKPEAGGYRFSIVTSKGTTSANLTPNPGGTINTQTSPELPGVLQVLRSLHLDISFLSDNRQLRSTLTTLRPSPERQRRVIRREIEEYPEPLDAMVRRDSDGSWLDLTMIASIAHDLFRRQLIEQGNFGQMNANTIYLDLAKRLASNWAEPGAPSKYDFENIVSELGILENRAAPIQALGAITSVPFKELREVLINSPPVRRDDLVRILQPFLESTRARIDALSPLADVLTVLVNELNGFLTGKQVKFDTAQGFRVFGSTESTLPLRSLSSGEKHLFLLFCSSYISRQNRCIFLIDEPELSLNVYWQRNLPRTLQRLTQGAEVQYVLATHSLEILTEFNHRISELKTQDAPTA